MTEWEHPLNLLDDPMLLIDWIQSVGKEEASKQLGDACRAHLENNGIRSGLELADKFGNASARIGEFLV